MGESWRLLEVEADEATLFADLATTRQLPHEPAAPPNRLRAVLRLQQGRRCWFLKTFTRTQWQNRLLFRWTRPIARSDAERELAMTQALRAAGIEAPRPVAIGSRGPASFYLCAQLPGLSLAEHAIAHGIERRMAYAVAMFCGDVLRRGFWLPDLSAHHVFVRQELGFFHLGLLDLHNGRLMPAGPPPRWLCRRVLRRFRRSVRALPVPWPVALRFALRLLRAAGRGHEARRILRSLPPFATASRYERPGRSRAYAERNPRRTARELALLAAVWPPVAPGTVLDSPCGTGRLLPLLRDRLGQRVLWADAALAMLQEGSQRAPHPVPPAVRADALLLPFADRSVDGVVVFRFLHHLEADVAADVVAEACRVARRFVVLSFFHPCSLHHLQRRVGDLLRARAPSRFALRPAVLRRWCQEHGFEPCRSGADLPFVRDLWVTSFVRRT